jgi:hypothetical protein
MNELEGDHQDSADHDDEAAIEPDLDPEDLHPALQPGRKPDELLLRPHRVVDGGDRHEDDADREQHLVEVALSVEPGIEETLENEPQGGRHQERQGQGRQERHPGPVHEHCRHVAARHREGPVGQVDEVHEAEGDRKAAGQDEQQHAIGDAIEEDREHGRFLTGFLRERAGWRVPSCHRCRAQRARHVGTGFPKRGSSSPWRP